MRFQVPQFIGIEDKIIGPFTIKQFIYLAGGAGMAFIAYKMLPFFVGVFIIVPIIGLSLALAFYKVNSKPFVFFLENVFRYVMGSKLYIWKKEEKAIEKAKDVEKEALLYVPKLSQSKLKDLTWNLDIKESLNPGTKEMMKQREV